MAVFESEGFKILVQAWEGEFQGTGKFFQVRIHAPVEPKEYAHLIVVADDCRLPEVAAAAEIVVIWMRGTQSEVGRSIAKKVFESLNFQVEQAARAQPERAVRAQPETIPEDLSQCSQEQLQSYVVELRTRVEQQRQTLHSYHMRELRKGGDFQTLLQVPRGAIPPPPQLGHESAWLTDLIVQLARIFSPGGVVKPKEIVEAIAEARKAGLKDVEEELRAELRAATRASKSEAVDPLSPGNESGWVGVPDAGLGAASGDAKDIPRRSKREVALANGYFNEAEQMLSDDYQALNDMFDGAGDLEPLACDDAEDLRGNE